MSDSTQFERISKQDIKHSVRGPSINMYSCLQHEDTAVQYFLGGIICIRVDTTFISDSHIFFYLRCGTSSKLQQIIIAIKTISIIKHKFHTVSRTIFLRLEMIGVGVVWGVG